MRLFTEDNVDAARAFADKIDDQLYLFNVEDQRKSELLKSKDALLAGANGEINALQVQIDALVHCNQELEHNVSSLKVELKIESESADFFFTTLYEVEGNLDGMKKTNEYLVNQNTDFKLQLKRLREENEELLLKAPVVGRSQRRSAQEIEEEYESQYSVPKRNKRDPPAGLESDKAFFVMAFDEANKLNNKVVNLDPVPLVVEGDFPGLVGKFNAEEFDLHFEEFFF